MVIRKTAWFPVVYMFAITALLSGALIGFSRATADKIQRNEQIFQERAVLLSLKLIDEKASPRAVHAKYQQAIQAVEVTSADGKTIAFFAYPKAPPYQAYAVPIAGRGFWDIIRGVVGVRDDKASVISIAFYEQHETPGLGAEIVKPKFRGQFEQGKTLSDGETVLDIRSAGEKLDEHSVHAVTGATQTSVRLERFLNEDLSAWHEAVLGGQIVPIAGEMPQ